MTATRKRRCYGCCVIRINSLGTERITIIEGLSVDGTHPLQRAWIAEAVPQCGYCQSGQIMQAASLLAQTPDPTDEQINSQ
jgi:isoquinoline 1-oxidoreductase subunit alpha